MTAAEIADLFGGLNKTLVPLFDKVDSFPPRVAPFDEATDYYETSVVEEQKNRIKTYREILASISSNTKKTQRNIDEALKANWPADKPKLLEQLTNITPTMYKDSVVLYVDPERPKVFVNITKIYSIADAALKTAFPDLKFKGNGPFSMAYEESMTKKHNLFVKQATTLEDYLLTAAAGSGIISCHSPKDRSYGYRFGQWTHMMNPSYTHWYLTDKTKTSIEGIRVDKRVARMNMICGWTLEGRFCLYPSVEYAQVSYKNILSKWLHSFAEKLGAGVSDITGGSRYVRIWTESLIKSNNIPSYSSDAAERYYYDSKNNILTTSMEKPAKFLLVHNNKYDRVCPKLDQTTGAALVEASH